MQFKSVNRLLRPLLKGGHDWQYIDINGREVKPRFYFSSFQWLFILLACVLPLKMTKGLSNDLVGYVMAAFSISVSLFMSLLVSIFDKFENTDFRPKNPTFEEKERLKQKKNFFKKFISITSYLVVLSILIIILCSLDYLFNLASREILPGSFTLSFEKIDWVLTAKNSVLFIYRVALNYFLLDYLLLTFFVAGSAYEYYISELNSVKIG